MRNNHVFFSILSCLEWLVKKFLEPFKNISQLYRQMRLVISHYLLLVTRYLLYGSRYPLGLITSTRIRTER